MTQDVTAPQVSSERSILRQPFTLAAMAALLLTGASAYTLWQFRSPTTRAEQLPIVTAPQIRTVTALGRLEPAGEVVQLSAPTSTDGNRLEQLLVKEGDRVRPGQVIAVLDARDRLQAALAQAQEQVRIAEANLDRVQAGAKRGEVAAQQATIARITAERTGDLSAQSATVARLQAELENAQAEDQRYADLYREGAISVSMRDSKRLALQTAQERLTEARATLDRTRLSRQEQLTEAQATLDRISEVRPVDVAAAEAEVGYARAAVRQAQANLDRAYIKVPSSDAVGMPRDFQVLKIHTRPGELVSQQGIADLGQTGQMVAVAEVYESEVGQVRSGQRVTMTSDSLPTPLRGTVERIGLQVQRQNVVNTDPSANVDARIVEVRVKLDQASSQIASRYTNLQVKVVIEQ
ncbi:MAG: ABC exporter membrane fusion protein [Leptolyngbyaceae cyanobacterium bins.59]|nr:ABC exporter membrane fusion protein [Leptolyngbyaceae cyanobacterium bins.59]